MKYIKEDWDRYRMAVVPFGAKEYQVEQTKQAFFAGVSSLFSLMVGKLNDPNVTDDDGKKMVNEIREELKEFLDSMEEKLNASREGKAQ